jgi:hypothetical protein
VDVLYKVCVESEQNVGQQISHFGHNINGTKYFSQEYFENNHVYSGIVRTIKNFQGVFFEVLTAIFDRVCDVQYNYSKNSFEKL